MGLAREMDVKMIACTMSMDAMGVSKDELLDDLTYGGVATYMADAVRSRVTLFICGRPPRAKAPETFMVDDNQDAPSPPASVEVGELLTGSTAASRSLLLDVRNQDEYESWKLEPRRPVETVHVPYFDFIEDADAALARVPRGRELVVLCAKGGSSEMVVELLGDAGVRAATSAAACSPTASTSSPRGCRSQRPTPGASSSVQVNRRGKGCLSYVIVAGGEAVVVDPSRHAEWYEAFVARARRAHRPGARHPRSRRPRERRARARAPAAARPTSSAAGAGLRAAPARDAARRRPADPAGRRPGRLDRGARDPHAGSHARLDVVPGRRPLPADGRHALRRRAWAGPTSAATSSSGAASST